MSPRGRATTYDFRMGGDSKHGLKVDLGDWFETNRDVVPQYIKRYFFGVPGAGPYAGRHFETLSQMGNPHRFEATDLLAVQALSVTVPSGSALSLLIDQAEEFNAELKNLPGCDIWEAERSIFETEGAATKLFRLLDRLPEVGTTKATKLMASKRPNLVPIQDTFVEEELMEPRGRFWLPIYDQLADASLRKFIHELTAAAPEGVSLLRRIDVSVWMLVNERKKA